LSSCLWAFYMMRTKMRPKMTTSIMTVYMSSLFVRSILVTVFSEGFSIFFSFLTVERFLSWSMLVRVRAKIWEGWRVWLRLSLLQRSLTIQFFGGLFLGALIGRCCRFWLTMSLNLWTWIETAQNLSVRSLRVIHSCRRRSRLQAL